MAVPGEMLLYPELLSNNQLITIIQERYLRIEKIEAMDRCELLELFKNYCMPFGQRKYRDSGRGKLLNKTRQCSPEPAVKLNISFSNHGSQSRKTQNCERLKPPPDLLSGHMKRIKLDNVCKDTTNNIKRKMSIDAVPPVPEVVPPKKYKPITWP